jgi:hypothetical protein
LGKTKAHKEKSVEFERNKQIAIIKLFEIGGGGGKAQQACLKWLG